MWYNNLPRGVGWTILWTDSAICPKCTGIRGLADPCPVCSATLPERDQTELILPDGGTIRVPGVVLMGAEGGYEDYIYLSLLEREWNRMRRDRESQDPSPYSAPISLGAPIVLLFWTYFESRINRLLRDALRNVPTGLLNDALSRHSSIKARLATFYKIAFDTTYYADLDELGYPELGGFLSNVMLKRNQFIHGNPASIDDALAEKIVESLKREHDAWIDVYNRRVPSPRTHA